MEILTLDELTSPDARTLRFTPLGLGTSGGLTASAAAEFQQRAISACDLFEDVVEGTRRSFERLRQLHAYGVLFYDAFTIAADSAWLVLEQALRERFVAYYEGVIPLKDRKSGARVPVAASGFAVVDAAFRSGGSHRKGAWVLELSRGGELAFRGSMKDLYRWARAEGLLDGRRSAAIEPLFVKSRNSVAHQHYRLSMPMESALAISDLAETINRLWGHATPGGRLYPAPVPREVTVVTWKDDSPGELNLMRGDQLEAFDEPGEWTSLVVLAANGDRGLWEFHTQFERTIYPAEMLWGPGRTGDAVVWLDRNRPQSDTAEYIDRLFAVRIRDQQVAEPRRPEVALGLTGDERSGMWLLVRADHPGDAFACARGVALEPTSLDETPEEGSVAAGLIFDGGWDRMVDVLRDEHGVTEPARPVAARVPRPWFGSDG